MPAPIKNIPPQPIAFQTLLSAAFLIFLFVGCDEVIHVQNEPLRTDFHEQLQLTTDKIELCASCPPGFERTPDNRCLLRTPYQQYQSLGNSGVGGLQTALPAWRDGFSPQQIDLGRYLFFDPILSGNGEMSCASCHHPDKGFSDGLPRSKGLNGEELARGAPSLWNTAFLQRFFWDARAESLEEQALEPLFHADEMNNSPQQLEATLNRHPAYTRLFQEAFPQTQNRPIAVADVATALTAFQSTLISLNSRYDQYVHGYHDALNQKEIEGFNVFRSFVARCSECHTPPLFTNQQIAVIGSPEPDGRSLDPGVAETTGEASLRGGFKVPGLRNIALTAPYMHSGNFSDLRDVVAFYNKGRGHAVPPDEDLRIHWHIWEPNLSEYELDRLVDFLHTLTDESFKPRVPEVLPSGYSAQFLTTLPENPTP
ncbi:MAG: cytochrome-c peroxidase [Cryomorphaceae bacterium]|nr:MAG: cytochrome-c peroxidase [Cryomorphaceae bacterium]